MFKSVATACVLSLCAFQSQAATVNGVFDNGLTGWDPIATTISSSANVTNVDDFVNIGSDAGNPYARLLTAELVASPVADTQLRQSFVVDASMALLSFDFGRVLSVANSDPSDTPSQTRADFFSVVVQDLSAPPDDSLSDTGRYTLLTESALAPLVLGTRTVHRAGLDPASPTSLSVEIEDVGGLLDTRVKVDLSSLAGRNVLLSFELKEELDNMRTGYGVDNVTLSGDVSVVPLPAGMWLLLGGLGSLVICKRRRA